MSHAGASFVVHYELGHSYKETWEPSEVHCPNCGLPKVWIESGEGDCETGPHHLCVNCGSSFALPFFNPNSDDSQDRQRRVAILAALAPKEDVS